MFKTGDIVYQIGKFEESKNCLSISIFKRTIGEQLSGTDKWLLKNSQGSLSGAASESEIFKTREDALDYVKKIIKK